MLDVLEDVLSNEQCHARELAYFGGLSHSEIAHALGLPLGTVKGRIRTALLRSRPVVGPGELVAT